MNDTVIGDFKSVEICITPQRNIQRMEFFADTSYVFHEFKINGLDVKKDKAKTVFSNRSTTGLFRYYVSKNEPLELHIIIPKNQDTQFLLYEASYDLLDNKTLNVPNRYTSMMPKPFVLNDAVVIKKSIQIN